jgi:very-short-patch-repair endonuclease
MATSKLQRAVGKRLIIEYGLGDMKENHRPEWLQTESGQRLELDFYIPSLKIGIEVQGAQHYSFVERFHVNYQGFTAQIERDHAKRSICEREGVRLFEVSANSEIEALIESIRPLIPAECHLKIIPTRATERSFEQWCAVLDLYVKNALRKSPDGRKRWGQYSGRFKVARRNLEEARQAYLSLQSQFGENPTEGQLRALNDSKRAVERRERGVLDLSRLPKADSWAFAKGVKRLLMHHNPPQSFFAGHPLLTAVASDVYSYRDEPIEDQAS